MKGKTRERSQFLLLITDFLLYKKDFSWCVSNT